MLMATAAPANGANGGGLGGADPHLGDNPNISERQINYGEALRTASLKLVGELPSLADIQAIANASSGTFAKAIYEQKIDALLADPRFAKTQIAWWKNTLKTGGAPSNGTPSLDTAATFAASVTVGDRPYTELFTATSGTCPTYANGVFTAANCANNAPTTGILTDPGLMAQFYSNMAFRRVRFVQETFVCNKFPAEYSTAPVPMGSSIYTSPWPFDSIAGGAGAKINFKDTSAVICANCHTTMNHVAPLFAHFDDKGMYDAQKIQVMTPVVPPATSTLADWLPAGQQTLAWRSATPITDLRSLGAAIAADPDVARCAVNRVWDWAFSRGDIVNDLATIPSVVTDDLTKAFTANGMKLKAVIRAVLTSDDFVKF
jgi:hypothetical protein